jgi:hypothetical protein
MVNLEKRLSEERLVEELSDFTPLRESNLTNGIKNILENRLPFYQVRLNIPSKEDFKLLIRKNSLNILLYNKKEKPSFFRSISLPSDADKKRIGASIQGRQLEIIIFKIQPSFNISSFIKKIKRLLNFWEKNYRAYYSIN